MASVYIPKNWTTFLGNQENKIELYELLSEGAMCIPTQKEIVITQAFLQAFLVDTTS